MLKTKPIKILIFFLVMLSLLTSERSFSASEPIVVATYKYSGVDRETAVAPLADWLSTVLQKQVVVHVTAGPAELAALAEAGAADIIVPNLVAYLDIQQRVQNYADFAVPAETGGGNREEDTSYSSSVIGKEISSLEMLGKLLAAQRSVNLYAVWPNSASGGLVGRAFLQSKLGEKFNNLNIHYVGSHELVFQHVSASEQSVGILASRQIAESKAERLFEIWRSGQLPFGPILCNSKNLPCQLLSKNLLADEVVVQRVLAGLKSGWVEFSDCTTLTTVNLVDYQYLRSIVFTQ